MSWINRIAETVGRWLGRGSEDAPDDVLTAADKAVREQMVAAGRETGTAPPALAEMPEIEPEVLADIEAVAAGKMEVVDDPDLTPRLIHERDADVPDSHEQVRHDVPALNSRVVQLQGQMDALRSTVYELTKTVQEIKAPTQLRKVVARITGWEQVDGIAEGSWDQDTRPVYKYAWREQKKVAAGYAKTTEDGGWEDVKLLAWKDSEGATHKGGHGIRGSIEGVTDGGTAVPASGADHTEHEADKNVAYNVMEANHVSYNDGDTVKRYNNGTLVEHLDWDADDAQDGVIRPIAIDTIVELEPVTIWDGTEKEWVTQWRFYATNGIDGPCPSVG